MEVIMAIYSYNTNLQSADVDQELIFIDDVRCGCSVTHCGGSGLFKIHRPGMYMVEFNASAVENDTAGDIIVQAKKNGVFVPGAITDAFSGTATAVVALEFMFLTQVKCLCDDEFIDFFNEGVSADFLNVACTITKVC
jgi:hypothetical protein